MTCPTIWMGVLFLGGVLVILFIAGLIARKLPSPQERARRHVEKRRAKQRNGDVT